MGKRVECYTPAGEMKLKNSVDARECVERCGFTMTPPESEAAIVIDKSELIAESEEVEKVSASRRGRKPKK